MRKEPRWVVAFLRALERTGEARQAALDAGVDHSTAYARRRAHGEFAEAWREALAARSARVKAEEEAEVAALRAGRPATAPLPNPSPAKGGGACVPFGGGAELVISGGKVRRVGHGRWSAAKEKIFFETLAVTASLRMAADSIGMSTNAILARRHSKPLFAAKFDAVAQNAQAGIDLFLAREAKKAFDPETLDVGDAEPRVTIEQAIKISQLNARRKAGGAASLGAPDEAPDASEEVEQLRARVLRKLLRLRDRLQKEEIAKGWVYDEGFDTIVPPGYVKGPDYRPPDEAGAAGDERAK